MRQQLISKTQAQPMQWMIFVATSITAIALIVLLQWFGEGPLYTITPAVVAPLARGLAILMVVTGCGFFVRTQSPAESRALALLGAGEAFFGVLIVGRTGFAMTTVPLWLDTLVAISACVVCLVTTYYANCMARRIPGWLGVTCGVIVLFAAAVVSVGIIERFSSSPF